MGAVWDPSAQCPQRGPALTHIRDTRTRSDGGCVFCGFGAMSKPCSGYGCVNSVHENKYCVKCQDRRAQAAVSHELEGHPDFIRDCPRCESDD